MTDSFAAGRTLAANGTVTVRFRLPAVFLAGVLLLGSKDLVNELYERPVYGLFSRHSKINGVNW